MSVQQGPNSFHIDRMAQAVIDAVRREIRPAGLAISLPSLRLRFGQVAGTAPVSLTFGDGVSITEKVFHDSNYVPTLNDWVAVLVTDENLYFIIGKSVQ